MANNNGIITTPISVKADIGYVLGEASGDVGTLCTSNNINMWSKHKPIHYPSWSENGNWVVDSFGNYNGIIIPSAIDRISFVNDYIIYQKPSGGASSPYRVLDFDGYNHNCICPWVINMPSGNIPVYELGKSGPGVRYSPSLNIPTGNLALSDIYPDMHFCVGVSGTYGIYYKTFTLNGTTNCDLTDCPVYTHANSGQTLTIVAGMAETATDGWVTNPGIIHTMCYPGHIYMTTITLVARVSTTYSLSASFSDMARPFGTITTTDPSALGGVIAATASWSQVPSHKPTIEYDLVSVTYRGTKRYSGDTISPITVSYPSTDLPQGSCGPETTGINEWTDTQGSGTINLTCPTLTPDIVDGENVQWTYVLNFAPQQ